MDSPPLEGCPQDGVVSKVYINDTQYFDNVPQIAWGFTLAIINHLKNGSKTERKEHLNMMIFYTIKKIIIALSETDRFTNEINKIEIE